MLSVEDCRCGRYWVKYEIDCGDDVPTLTAVLVSWGEEAVQHRDNAGLNGSGNKHHHNHQLTDYIIWLISLSNINVLYFMFRSVFIAFVLELKRYFRKQWLEYNQINHAINNLLITHPFMKSSVVSSYFFHKIVTI